MEQPQINVAGIYQETRRRCIAEARQSLPLQERLETALPWFLVVIQIVFFALSASHTANMIARIVPPVRIPVIDIDIPVAPLAPVGFELGLSVVAMMNYASRKRGETPPKVWVGIEVLLFATTLLSNLSGSVIEAVKPSSLTSTNVAVADVSLLLTLIMAFVFSFIIPVGNKVIGQATMHLIIEQRQNGDPAERRWRAVMFSELMTAFYQAYLLSGLKAGEAKQKANSVATGYVAALTAGSRPALPAPTSDSNKSDRPNTSDNTVNIRTDRTQQSDSNRTASNGQPNSVGKPNVRVRNYVVTLLNSNPGMTLDDVVVREVARAVEVSPDTASLVIRKMKEEAAQMSVPVSNNGHSSDS